MTATTGETGMMFRLVGWKVQVAARTGKLRMGLLQGFRGMLDDSVTFKNILHVHFKAIGQQTSSEHASTAIWTASLIKRGPMQ